MSSQGATANEARDPSFKALNTVAHRMSFELAIVVPTPDAHLDGFSCRDDSGSSPIRNNLPPEAIGHPFSLLLWAEYIYLHCDRSSLNPVIGVAIEENGRIELRSLFGHMLSNAIAPFDHAARKRFVHFLALISIRPHFYHSSVDEWTLQKYKPPYNPSRAISGTNMTIWRPSFDQSHDHGPILEEHVIVTLIRNNIPTSWIDHIYPWAYLMVENAILRHGRPQLAFIGLDQDRRLRIWEYGTPPAIASLDGWWEPGVEERRRKASRRRELQRSGLSPPPDTWLPAPFEPGMELTPRAMRGQWRNATPSRRSLKKEREAFIALVNLEFPSIANYHNLEHWRTGSMERYTCFPVTRSRARRHRQVNA